MILKLPYICLLLMLVGCWGEINSSRKLRPVNAKEITYAEISKGFDTLSVSLTKEQIAKLADWINKTENAQMYKSIAQYVVVLETIKDTLIYKVNGKLFGEADLYIELQDTNYFPQIYKNGPKQRAVIDF